MATLIGPLEGTLLLTPSTRRRTEALKPKPSTSTSRTTRDPVHTLPIGPKVVPFWDYLVEFYKYDPPKRTTLGPMGKYHALNLKSPDFRNKLCNDLATKLDSRT